MSSPRQILPGSTYLVTRRCSERRYFLRPDGLVRPVFGYVLAAASERFDVEIHCCVVMGNHYHAVVTDWDGRIPDFLAWVHRLVAVVLNAYRGRWEAMWSSSKPSVVRLETADDILDKMLYVLGNPVTAGVVPSASEWPGLIGHLDPSAMLSDVDFRRPDKYFAADSRLPERVSLRFTKPPGFADQDNDKFAVLLSSKLAQRESEAVEQMQSSGRDFQGAERASRVKWSDAPTTPTLRRGRDPHVAARKSDVRVRALRRLKAFRAEYREALVDLRAGVQGKTFPAGTYALRRRLGVSCHAPPPGSCWERPRREHSTS